MGEGESSCVVRFPLDRVATFFAEPSNLEKLTPAWLHLRLTALLVEGS